MPSLYFDEGKRICADSLSSLTYIVLGVMILMGMVIDIGMDQKKKYTFDVRMNNMFVYPSFYLHFNYRLGKAGKAGNQKSTANHSGTSNTADKHSTSNNQDYTCSVTM